MSYLSRFTYNYNSISVEEEALEKVDADGAVMEAGEVSMCAREGLDAGGGSDGEIMPEVKKEE